MSVAFSFVATHSDLPAAIGFSDTLRDGGRTPDGARPTTKFLTPVGEIRDRRRKQRPGLFPLFADSKPSIGLEPKNGRSFLTVSSLAASEAVIPSERRVYDVVVKQASLVKEQLRSNLPAEMRPELVSPGATALLDEAYDRCGDVCAEYAKTFYLGTLLMTPEKRKAIWAIYVWCRRTDELVDGPNATHITPSALDRWEGRLEDLFAGRPFDMFDAALSDTVSKYPVDIQPFKDMIEGMRLDLKKSRYNNFDELYLYCYYVAGTVGLMSVPVMGIAPESQATIESVYNAALALGIANQLTNILRDVGEDARRGRVYLPQDELAQAGISDDDIFSGKVTDKWRSFMKSQIKRARMFFDEAEKGITNLSQASRWPVWASLLLYSKILDEIEANDYNNFTKRAYVSKAKKLLALPVAYGRFSLAHQEQVQLLQKDEVWKGHVS